MISFKIYSVDSMSQILYFAREEPTTLDFELSSCSIQAVKDVVDIIDLFLHSARVNDDVIKIEKALLSCVLFKKYVEGM